MQVHYANSCWNKEKAVPVETGAAWDCGLTCFITRCFLFGGSVGEQLRAFSSALLGFLCFLDLLDLPELLGLQLYDCLDLWWGFLDLCDCWDLCDFFECLNLGREAPLTAAGALRPTIYNTKQHKSRLSAVVKLTTIIDRHQNRTTHTHTHTQIKIKQEWTRKCAQ